MSPPDDVDPNPSPSTPVADLYERSVLEIVSKEGEAIAKHFVYQPLLYKNLPDDVALILENIWYLSGTDPRFPDMTKREKIFTPILGPSDGTPGEKVSQFHMDSASLRERARAFTERQVETGVDNLRQAFVDEAITFQAYLQTFVENAVVVNADRQTRSIFNDAVSVLRDKTATGVFGLPPASQASWPVSLTTDQQGARVIEEVAKQLEMDMAPSQSQFIIMQRIGHFGATTIRETLAADLTPDPQIIDPIIKVTYSWKTALDALGM